MFVSYNQTLHYFVYCVRDIGFCWVGLHFVPVWNHHDACLWAGQRLALKSQRVLKTTIPDKGTLPSAVVGLALLGNLLYVVRKRSPNVFVFDTEDQRRVSITSSCFWWWNTCDHVSLKQTALPLIMQSQLSSLLLSDHRSTGPQVHSHMLGQTVSSTDSSNREGPIADGGQPCMTVRLRKRSGTEVSPGLSRTVHSNLSLQKWLTEIDKTMTQIPIHCENNVLVLHCA